jgi:hypothetical protein
MMCNGSNCNVRFGFVDFNLGHWILDTQEVSEILFRNKCAHSRVVSGRLKPSYWVRIIKLACPISWSMSTSPPTLQIFFTKAYNLQMLIPPKPSECIFRKDPSPSSHILRCLSRKLRKRRDSQLNLRSTSVPRVQIKPHWNIVEQRQK